MFETWRRILDAESNLLYELIFFCVLQVKVILGEDRECTGQLLSIDDEEGVVKLDRGNISMIMLSHLCKMPTDAE